MKTERIGGTAERITQLIVDQFGVALDSVVPQARFIADLGADSLDVVELVMAIEDEFGIAIPDDAAETIHTVGDAIRYIEAVEIKPREPSIQRPPSDEGGVPERRAAYE